MLFELHASAWNTNNIHTPLTEYLHSHVRPVHTYARVRSSIVNKELTVKRAVPLLLSQRLFHIAHLPLALNWVTCHFYRSFHHVSYCVLRIRRCAHFSALFLREGGRRRTADRAAGWIASYRVRFFHLEKIPFYFPFYFLEIL